MCTDMCIDLLTDIVARVSLASHGRHPKRIMPHSHVRWTCCRPMPMAPMGAASYCEPPFEPSTSKSRRRRACLSAAAYSSAPCAESRAISDLGKLDSTVVSRSAAPSRVSSTPPSATSIFLATHVSEHADRPMGCDTDVNEPLPDSRITEKKKWSRPDARTAMVRRGVGSSDGTVGAITT